MAASEQQLESHGLVFASSLSATSISPGLPLAIPAAAAAAAAAAAFVVAAVVVRGMMLNRGRLICPHRSLIIGSGEHAAIAWEKGSVVLLCAWDCLVPLVSALSGGPQGRPRLSVCEGQKFQQQGAYMVRLIHVLFVSIAG
eukprot:1160317-Pelagomonas_calceolata.AAC.10